MVDVNNNENDNDDRELVDYTASQESFGTQVKKVEKRELNTSKA